MTALYGYRPTDSFVNFKFKEERKRGEGEGGGLLSGVCFDF